jgi:hypothetical protein
MMASGGKRSCKQDSIISVTGGMIHFIPPPHKKSIRLHLNRMLYRHYSHYRKVMRETMPMFMFKIKYWLPRT